MKSKDEVVQNLRHSGCNQNMIDEFINCAAMNTKEAQLGILSRHRRTLLEELHASQKKLHCLDFLYQEIKTDCDNQTCMNHINNKKENII